LAAVGQALKSFWPVFDTVSDVATREGVRNATLENRDAITKLEANVRADRSGAREAARSGDFSKFIPEGFQHRRVVVDTAQDVVGREAAYSAAEDIKSTVRETGLDEDPAERAERFLAEELKGMSPRMALSFRETSARLVDKEVTDFRKSRLSLQQLQADVRSKKVVQDQIVNDHVPLTEDGLDKVRQQVIGSMPRTAPDAVLRADALVDDTIISMAAQGNSKALRLLHVVYTKRGGTSIYDRNGEAYEKAVASWITQQEKFQTVEALEDMQGLEGRFDNIEAGQSEGDTLESLWVDVQSYGQSHGKHTRFRSLRAKLASKLDAEGIRIGNLDLIAQGKSINMSTAEWNKSAPKAYDGSMAASFSPSRSAAPVPRCGPATATSYCPPRTPRKSLRASGCSRRSTRRRTAR
jgi:hypothetical protein